MIVEVVSGLVAVFILLILSAFFSGSEIALMSCRKRIIEAKAEKGSRHAKIVLKLLESPEKLLSTILVGNNLANTAAISVATYLLLLVQPQHGEVIAYTTLGMTVILLLVSEITPKTLAAYRATDWALLSAPFLYVFMLVLYPVVQVIGTVVRKILLSLGIQNDEKEFHVSIDEFKTYLTLLRPARSKVPAVLEMAARIPELTEHTVREIMIHRDYVQMIALGMPLEEIDAIIFNTGYSRFPVYRRNKDIIIGILYVKDYFPARIQKKLIHPSDIEKILRQPLVLPSTTVLENALARMQTQKLHFAVIYNEYGVFEGIVTLEDILEEIVGEIIDEYDREEHRFVLARSEDRLIVDGRIPIKDLNELLAEEIPEEGDYTTLAGFLMKIKEDFPEVGDVLEYGNYVFTIVERRGFRIKKVELRRKSHGEAHAQLTQESNAQPRHD